MEYQAGAGMERVSAVRRGCKKHKTAGAAKGMKTCRVGFSQSCLSAQLTRKARSATALTKGSCTSESPIF